jgi:trigger factor
VQPAVDVSQSEVDEQLEVLRTRHAPAVEEPEGTSIENDHIVSLDFVGRVDGEAFEGGSGQGVELEIGSGSFIPGFEEQLVGAATGDDVEVNVRFPEEYGNAELAGKDAVFACHVVAVKRKQLPELDDDFAKDMGEFETLDALKERIRADLRAAQERESKQVLRWSTAPISRFRRAWSIDSSSSRSRPRTSGCRGRSRTRRSTSSSSSGGSSGGTSPSARCARCC